MGGNELVGLTNLFQAFLKLLIIMFFQETLHHPLKLGLVISNRVKDVPCLNVLQIKVVSIVSVLFIIGLLIGDRLQLLKESY